MYGIREQRRSASTESIQFAVNAIKISHLDYKCLIPSSRNVANNVHILIHCMRKIKKLKNHSAHKCAPLKFKEVLTVGKKRAECVCPICYSCISCNSSCLIHIILQIILQSGPGDEQEGGWGRGAGTVQRQEKILHRLCRSVIISQAAAKMPRG